MMTSTTERLPGNGDLTVQMVQGHLEQNFAIHEFCFPSAEIVDQSLWPR